MPSTLGLLRTYRRELWKGVRTDLSQFQPPETPDEALTEVVERPFESLPDTEARLARLEERLRERGDRRSVFLSIYAKMTKEVRAGIEADEFEDPVWMRSYVRTFANHYRRGFLAFERGDVEEVPAPWQVAFGTAIADDSLVIQDAFLGVNAHINYDLALALDGVGIDPDRESKYRDHRAINDILGDLVDAQQSMLARIYAPGVENIDAVFGQFDEALSLLTMTKGREQAWRIATVRTDVRWPLTDRVARWVLRTTALGIAALVRSPGIEPAVIDSLRAIERDDVGIETLLNRVANQAQSQP